MSLLKLVPVDDDGVKNSFWRHRREGYDYVLRGNKLHRATDGEYVGDAKLAKRLERKTRYRAMKVKRL